MFGLLAVGLLVAGAVAAADPSNNPSDPVRLVGGEVVVYQMDTRDNNQPSTGFTKDDSGNGNNAQLAGVTFQGSGGKFGGGYQCNGFNNDIKIPNSPTSNQPEGTLMLWVNIRDFNPGQGKLFVKSNPGVSSSLAILIQTTGIVQFGGGSFPSLNSVTSIPTGTWSHIAITWGSGGQKLYINGNQDASSTYTGGVDGSSTTTMLCNDPNAVSTRGFDGTVDEVRFYNKALAASDIASLMNLPYAGTTSPPCLTPVANSAPAAPSIAADGMGDGSYGWVGTGFPYTFSASSTDPDGDPITYTWNFGDGKSGTGAAADHAFAGSGAKKVTVTAKDDPSARNAAQPNCPPAAAQSSTSDAFVFTAIDGDTWGTALTHPTQSCVNDVDVPIPAVNVIALSCTLTADADIGDNEQALAAKVCYWVDDAPTKLCATKAPYKQTYDSTKFPVGQHTLQVEAYAKGDKYKRGEAGDFLSDEFAYLNVNA
jgi:hypothetical protein